MMEKFIPLFGFSLGAWMTYLLWTARNRWSGNRLARPGTVYVCHACGKRSHDRRGTKAIDHGWDSSCMTRATLCRDSSLIFGNDGRVAKARAA